jgi:hypothetical protein
LKTMSTTKSFWIRFALCFAVIFVLAALFHNMKTQAAAPGSAPSTAKKSVVVELFTSEGCSSCPPADQLLGRLRQEANANGAEVIPLGFHVDYWNSGSWRDRFSSAAYSRRQEDYARKLRTGGPYTPQMVVNGEAEFVGSSAGRAQEAIAEAAAQAPSAQVEISSAGRDSIQLKVKSAQPADVFLALTEDNLVTRVGGGENDGRTLRHSAVVRDFRRVGQVKDGAFSGAVPVTIQPDWKRDDLRVVVFVQDGGSERIFGAASRPLKSLAGTN